MQFRFYEFIYFVRLWVYFIREKHAQCSPDSFYYYYYHYYYYHYCYCVSLCLVGSSGIFPREQVAPSNLRSLGLVWQFLQFQAMLLFANVLCCSLCLTSPPSLSIFLMSLLGPQLQLKQPQLETSSRSFSLPVLIRCNCLSFPVLSTQSFLSPGTAISISGTFFCTVQLCQAFCVEWHGLFWY